MIDLSKWFNEEYSMRASITERDISMVEAALKEADDG
jgi:hypothetical protein